MLPDAIWNLLIACTGLALFGVAVLVALRMMPGQADPSRDDPLRLMLTVVGRTLVALGVLGGCLLVLGFSGLIVWGAALVVWGIALRRNQLARQQALVWAMTVAAERLIPLIPTIEAFADERGGRLAHRARRLAESLRAGTPLPAAIAGQPGLLPPEVLPAIRIGCETGALAPALRDVVTAGNVDAPLWRSLAAKIVYLSGLLVFAVVVIGFMMVKITPAMAKIFADFEMNLPAVTRVVIAGSEVLMTTGLMTVIAVLALLLFAYTVLRYGGWIRWGLPGVNRLVRRLDTASILDFLALVADRGRPLPEAMAALADSYPRRSVRRRLGRVCFDLADGADWCGSLRRHGLINDADLALLQAAQRAGNLTWALRQTAASSRRRLAYRLNVAVQILFPLVIVSYAGLALLFVVSYLLPLVALISGLSP